MSLPSLPLWLMAIIVLAIYFAISSASAKPTPRGPLELSVGRIEFVDDGTAGPKVGLFGTDY